MEYKLEQIAMYSNEKIEIDKINYENYISTENMLPNRLGVVKAKTLPNQRKVCFFKKDNILISNIRPYFKKIWIANCDGGCSNDVLNIIVKDKNIVLPKYLYYVLFQNEFFDYVMAGNKGTKMPRGDKSHIMNYMVNIPNVEMQTKIVTILENIDKKIELNNQINNNLLEIINCIYKDAFYNNIVVYDKAENIANITIGKTPPRSEKECFTFSKNDVKWVSIADLVKSGTYIFNTSERLTMKSIDKYNVKIIPKDTIILSFKLTIGRIAITTENMATNEAIAHFNLNNKNIKYYLYSYLKNFDYEKLGNTSSIATAVNSKIIKSMPIAIPNETVLRNYNRKVESMFGKILKNEKENRTLAQLRDTLLPKLMNDEIELEKIEIT